MNRTKSFWRRLALFVVLLTGFNFFLVQFSILGSGVLPVPQSVLLLISFALASTSALVLLIIPKKKTRVAVFLSIFTVLVYQEAFIQIVLWAYQSAKAYGAEIAPLIQEFKQQQGRWPKSLDELPHQQLRALKPGYQWPLRLYSYSEKYLTWDVIGGFSITYDYEQEWMQPQFSVQRRDLQSHWDWERMLWSESR